jgi:hypothetical protein
MRWLVAIALAGAAAAISTQLVGGQAAPTQVLPDLDQAVPSAISVKRHRGGYVVAFASAVDNVGRGPLVVEGRRAGTTRVMSVRQLIRRSDGSTARRELGRHLAYEYAKTHAHWHLHRFARYEIRYARDPDRAVRGIKAGFCLGDRYETNRNRTLPGEPAEAVWTHECGRGRPDLRSMREGISVGYGDDYAPYLEGQFVSLRGLPAGRFLLVHVANPDRLLRERSYANNASSVLFELRRPSGRAPWIRVIERCPHSDVCRAG